MVPRLFDIHGNERLLEWKKFRDHLETSNTPFEDLAVLWSQAPFVNRYLNPFNYKSWPGPWKLLIDGQFDDLAISLGMLYTIQLTERFKNSKFEIRQTFDQSPKSFLIIDDSVVLNWEYRTVTSLNNLGNTEFRVIWANSNNV